MRASSCPALALGVEQADSWTTDGHKWLNTPYDCAMAICRDADALAAAMNSDAAYACAARDAQKNLTLEFSRRARGIAIWAALANLGREGLRELVDRHIAQAGRLADALRAGGYQVLNRVHLNQVLVRADSDEQTVAIRQAAQASGDTWFGPTVWQERPALRLSVSSWRTTDADIDALIALLLRLKQQFA
ncbi:MAG TPA: pyridoxal-dependent decarboxylase [Pseudomonas sp.]